ncbi:MAG: hypothetical protein RIR89_855 [Actinomycetota bacterium]
MIKFVVSGEVIEWRGPSPFYFLPTPPDVTSEIEVLKRELSYGWGVIPARITLGEITVSTSLIPRDGSFYIPLKDAIRKPNGVNAGQKIKVTLELA